MVHRGARRPEHRSRAAPGIPTCDSAEAAAAFPPALCEALAPLPIGPDYRQFNQNKDALHRSPFQDAWFGLLANLLDLERAEIEQRDLRRRRRQRQITIAVTTAVIVLLSAALVVALLSRGQAIRERDLAEERRKQALARRLMTDSLSVADREYEDIDSARARSRAAFARSRLQRPHARCVEPEHCIQPDRPPTRRSSTGDRRGERWTLDCVGRCSGTVVVGDFERSAQEHKLGINGTAEAAAVTRRRSAALAVGNDIELWDVAQSRREHVLRGHTSAVTSVCFSPDGTLLASGGWDSAAIVWNVEDGRARYPPLASHTESPNPLSLAKGVQGVAFNSDASVLATTGGDNTAVLWNARTGQRAVGPLTGHATRSDQLFPGVRAVAFSPDNASLPREAIFAKFDSGTPRRANRLASLSRGTREPSVRSRSLRTAWDSFRATSSASEGYGPCAIAGRSKSCADTPQK